jgi:hypothetical protein
VHSVPTRGETIRTAVEIAAILAAGAWALYTFVYVQQIKPLGEAASFSVPTSVDQSPTVDGVAFITIHRHLQNTGDVGIDLAAESLSVYGERIVRPSAAASRSERPARSEVRFDLRRKPVKLLYSMAKLREGAIGGSTSDFYLPPHSSADQDVLVAFPAKTYPVVLIVRKDYVAKAPIVPKEAIRIVKGSDGAYDLQSAVLQGEYDSEGEYPIRP